MQDTTNEEATQEQKDVKEAAVFAVAAGMGFEILLKPTKLPNLEKLANVLDVDPKMIQKKRAVLEELNEKQGAAPQSIMPNITVDNSASSSIPSAPQGPQPQSSDIGNGVGK